MGVVVWVILLFVVCCLLFVKLVCGVVCIWVKDVVKFFILV